MSWCGGGEMSWMPGYRVAEPRDQLGDLVGGELAAFAGLGALHDLDLELLRAGEVLVVTPKRAEATCLMRLSARSPFSKPW